jgi:hypothetical protein
VEVDDAERYTPEEKQLLAEIEAGALIDVDRKLLPEVVKTAEEVVRRVVPAAVAAATLGDMADSLTPEVAAPAEAEPVAAVEDPFAAMYAFLGLQEAEPEPAVVAEPDPLAWMTDVLDAFVTSAEEELRAEMNSALALLGV